MEKTSSPHLSLAKNYWKAFLRPHDLAIDATCGNGHDTFFLTELCPVGHVIGLDIQPEAIAQTHALAPKAVLHRLSHAEIDRLPLPYAPRLIVYNLGYLPGGNKAITTTTKTTLISVDKSLNLLASDGALSITCYPGHEEGQREEESLLQWAAALPLKWSVCHHKWVNRPRSPSLLWVQAAAQR